MLYWVYKDFYRIDSERLDKMYKYVFSVFDNEINLDEIANFNVNSICRYLKKKQQNIFKFHMRSKYK